MERGANLGLEFPWQLRLVQSGADMSPYSGVCGAVYIRRCVLHVMPYIFGKMISPWWRKGFFPPNIHLRLIYCIEPLTLLHYSCLVFWFVKLVCTNRHGNSLCPVFSLWCPPLHLSCSLFFLSLFPCCLLLSPVPFTLSPTLPWDLIRQ